MSHKRVSTAADCFAVLLQHFKRWKGDRRPNGESSKEAANNSTVTVTLEYMEYGRCVVFNVIYNDSFAIVFYLSVGHCNLIDTV